MQVIWARPLSLMSTQLNCTVLRVIKDFKLNLYAVGIEKELTWHFICWITSFGDLRAALTTPLTELGKPGDPNRNLSLSR